MNKCQIETADFGPRPDFRQIEHIPKLKATFFGYLLPMFEFTLGQTPHRRGAIGCFRATTGSPLELSKSDNTYEVALPAMRDGRNKINCTASVADKPGEFYWYSHQWVVADPDGQWLKY